MAPGRSLAMVTLLWTLLVFASLGEAAATFLRVADDMDTSAAGVRFFGVTVTECGIKCFGAGKEKCRGFVWRPVITSSFVSSFAMTRSWWSLSAPMFLYSYQYIEVEISINAFQHIDTGHSVNVLSYFTSMKCLRTAVNQEKETTLRLTTLRLWVRTPVDVVA